MRARVARRGPEGGARERRVRPAPRRSRALSRGRGEAGRAVTAPVLAIRPRALGDVVLTTPALRSLARGHAGVPIDVVTEARYAPLLAGLPGIDRVIPLAPGAAGTWRALRDVRRR